MRFYTFDILIALLMALLVLPFIMAFDMNFSEEVREIREISELANFYRRITTREFDNLFQELFIRAIKSDVNNSSSSYTMYSLIIFCSNDRIVIVDFRRND